MSFDVGQARACILLILEVNVKASLYCLDAQSFAYPLLTGHILLKSQKGSFVGGMLSDLHQSVPVVRGKLLLAVMALCIFLHEFHHFRLLNFGIFINLPNELDLHSDSLAMWLSPNKFRLLHLRLP